MANANLVAAVLAMAAMVASCGQTASDSGKPDGAAQGEHACGAGKCSENEACWCVNPTVCCPIGTDCLVCQAPGDSSACANFAGNWNFGGCWPPELCFVKQSSCQVEMNCVDGVKYTGSLDGNHASFEGAGMSCSASFTSGSAEGDTLQGTCTGGDAAQGCVLTGKAN